ncbi:Uncharacterised protein [Mycobacteroides abscessus subsp. abscessus]|nr:Uncharacterised protein [Mycobacteroides abscessus subsp. abscessus]SKY39269.1 Uncharacterised protein [Mycobacteroides abscessus subsp. abscessus]
MPPTALRIDRAAQGVHAGVQVRADPDTVHPGVVANVHNGVYLMLAGIRSEQALDAEEEARSADATDENGDFHVDRD